MVGLEIARFAPLHWHTSRSSNCWVSISTLCVCEHVCLCVCVCTCVTREKPLQTWKGGTVRERGGTIILCIHVHVYTCSEKERESKNCIYYYPIFHGQHVLHGLWEHEGGRNRLRDVTGKRSRQRARLVKQKKQRRVSFATAKRRLERRLST